MFSRKLRDRVFKLGAIDWDRRVFDELIPLPDGTSYNAYLVCGSEKTALIDSVDPDKSAILMEQLSDVDTIDYVIANHAEQDHSGTIPLILAKYPNAKVVVSNKCKQLMIEHLHIPAEKIVTVAEGDTLSLGNYTFEFIYTPWVHWPETMTTYLREERIAFTCDFFGSHIATTDLFAHDEDRVYEAAKRYYAEIMMPFRTAIQKNIEKLKNFPIDIIAPSHGPAYENPSFIIDAYSDWISDKTKNSVVIAYVSMHGSTRILVDHLVASLAKKGITVHQFDLSVTDIGKLAIALVDATTLIVGTPTVHVGPHPTAVNAAYLANALRPKLKYVSILNSYGWATKAVEQLAATIASLHVEVLPPVLCKGMPRQADLDAVEVLSATIAEKHASL